MAGKQGEQRESIEELAEETNKIEQVTMKLGLDVSEALTGLKAIERQAKAAKRAVAELGESASDKESEWIRNLRKHHEIQGQEGNWDYNAYMCGMYNAFELTVADIDDREPNYRPAPPKPMSDYSTKELADELAKREGVKEYVVTPEQQASIGYMGVRGITVIDGPARIVVNRD